MKKSDLLAGLLLAGLGVFVIHQAVHLDYVNEYGPGPGFLPFWLGVGLLALASLLILASVFRHSGDREVASETWRPAGRVLVTWAGLAAAIALLDRLGFILSFAIFTFVLVLVMDRRSPLTAAAVAVGIGWGFYLIFAVALRVRLPVGPWGF